MAWVLLFLYQAIGLVAFLLSSPVLLVRALRHREEMRERLGWGRKAPPVDRPLWIHAASLGELEALRALLEDPRGARLRPFLLSVLSVSARAQAPGKIPQASAVVCAPLDLFFCVDPFLRRVRPRGLLLLETELWPWTLAACHRRGIPVAVLSGRLSRRRWAGTRLLALLLRPLLRRIALVGAQSEGDAARFRFLGANRVDVTGNLKYRTEQDTQQSVANSATRTNDEASGERCLFVAGSLRRGEETVLQAARVSGVALILVPRHTRERAHWLEACRRADLPVLARSACGFELPPLGVLRGSTGRQAARERILRRLGDQVLLVDVHGELGSWYALADAAFVGGTLAPIGGHNLFEPAREGIPVAFGPHTEGVAELAEPLLRSGGGTCVPDATALCRWLARLAEDPRTRRETGAAARRAALEAAGASDRTWPLLEALGWPLGAQRGGQR